MESSLLILDYTGKGHNSFIALFVVLVGDGFINARGIPLKGVGFYASTGAQAMVRFLRSTCNGFETRDELDRFLLVEQLVALLHIPAAMCLAIGALAGAGIVPYASAYKSHLLLAASLFLVVCNARDANECVRNFFLSERNHERDGVYYPMKNLRGTVEDQMHMFAAVMMTLASLSLFNSSLIALIEPGTSQSVTSKRQYALAFCLYLVGAAGNNFVSESVFPLARYTRALLSFQNVICSASFGVSGFLMLPSLSRAQENTPHTTVVTVSVTLGSLLAVLSAAMQYFYMSSVARVHVEIFERKLHEEELQKTFQVKQEQSESRRGYLCRLRDAIKTKGKSLMWRQVNHVGNGQEVDGHGQLRTGSVRETDINPSLRNPDGYDDSSFNSGHTLSDSSSWSEADEAPRLQEEHRFMRK